MATKSKRTSSTPMVAAAAFEALESRQLMSAGALDTTFGTGGKLVSQNLPFSPAAVASVADGKTIAVGSMNGNFAVARLYPNGTIDRSFAGANNGIAIADFGADRGEQANAVAIQSDGKIVVVGNTMYDTIIGWQDYGNMAIARFNTNGTLDRSFDGNGMRTNDFHSRINAWGADEANAVAIQPDGKIIVGGSAGEGNYVNNFDTEFAVVRINANGSMDGSFGSGGQLHFSNLFSQQGVTSLAVQSDGKIVVGGMEGTSQGNQFSIARLTNRGALDSTFNGYGRAPAVNFGQHTYLRQLVLGYNNSILAIGGGNDNFALSRFTSAGKTDTTFGNGSGKVVTDFGSGELANTATITPDGQILVGGVTNGNFAIARYNYAGALDQSFGSGGKVNTGFGATEAVMKLTTRADGKIVALGVSERQVMQSRYMPTAPNVGVTSSYTSTNEGKSDASFTFWRDQALSFPTRVYFNIGGTATFGVDYGGLSTLGSIGYADIPAGRMDVTVPIRTVLDGQTEGNETVIATLRSDVNYVVDHNSTKTLTIVDQPGNGSMIRHAIKRPLMDDLFSEKRIAE